MNAGTYLEAKIRSLFKPAERYTEEEKEWLNSVNADDLIRLWKEHPGAVSYNPRISPEERIETIKNGSEKDPLLIHYIIATRNPESKYGFMIQCAWQLHDFGNIQGTHFPLMAFKSGKEIPIDWRPPV